MISDKQTKKVIEDMADYSFRAKNRYSSNMYHYCSPSVVENILLTDKIQLRFTKSDCMNDLSEGNQALGMFKLAVEECHVLGQITDKYRDYLLNVEQIAIDLYSKNIADDIFRNMYEKFCVGFQYYLCCFSADGDSLPLWNYYVKDKKYEGYCIQLDHNKIEKAKFHNEEYEIWVSSVIYFEFFDQCKDLILRHKGYFRYAKEKELATLSYMFSCYLEKYKLVVKNHCFRHEIEVRAILRQKRDEPLVVQYDWSKGFPRPYIIVDFDKSAFRSITIGPLLEKDISRTNTENFLCSRDYPSKNRVRNSKVPIRF